MNKKHYPILVEALIDSAVHELFDISSFASYGDRLSIKTVRGVHECKFETEITEEEGVTPALDIIDTLCMSLSIVQQGIFSRRINEAHSSLAGIKWLSGSPPSFPCQGLIVTENKDFDYRLMPKVEALFNNFLRIRARDEGEYAILIEYTVSSRFFNTQMIRESALNYFSIVEMIASIILPSSIANRSVYSLSALHRAAKKLCIDPRLVDEAYRLRGELAHGHSKHLLLMQHSLGEHQISSWSLKTPALSCKNIADEFINKYLELRL